MSAAAMSVNTGPPAASRSPSLTSPASSAQRPQLKTNTTGKVLDGMRKQAASPVDASAAKKSTQKAWQGGSNPITQRSSVTTPSNGAPNGSARPASIPAKPTPSAPSGSNEVEKHAHDRLLFLLANFTGLECAVTLRNGEKFCGIFSGASLESSGSRYTMKMVKRTSTPTTQQTNNTAAAPEQYIGNGDDHVAAFDLQDTIDLHVASVELVTSDSKNHNGLGPSFRTDAEISGNLAIRERELQRWQPGPEADMDLSLEDSGVAGWDQFATNARLYNVQTDYDEDLYTTTIDRTDPKYKEKEALASRIANEIQSSAPVNSHVAEERTMNADAEADLDEEEKYSGVRRNITPLSRGQPNAYIPPSRRPVTSQPTVSGAPFDPAIISSQLSRPGPPQSTNSDGLTTSAAQSIPLITRAKESPEEQPTMKLPTSARAAAIPTAAPAAPSDKSLAPPQIPAAMAQRRAGEGGTENVERKVLDSFKQFSNTEKLRVQQHQRAMAERQRANARQEKSVKLNDLKKFAENFKLYSRVPDDLVPILAKTKEKQQEIVIKAESQAREKEHNVKVVSAASPAAPTKLEAGSIDAKPTRPSSGRPDTGNEPTSPLNQRQRISQNLRGPNQPMSSPRGPALPNHRSAGNQGGYRTGTMAPQIPPVALSDLRIPPPSASQVQDTGLVSPSSSASTRLNVKAIEFRPNPAASTFTPTGPSKDSPQGSKRPSVSATVTSPTLFAKEVKTPSERKPFAAAFNPIKRMLEKTEAEKRTKDFAANGGVPQAYRTPPTWDCPEANRDKSYADAYVKSLGAAISPMHTPSNGVMPHQHQLPPHLQNGAAQMPSAQQAPRFFPQPPPHVPNQHFEEQRMQYASSNSSVQPSPRMGHPSMAYPNQMHPQMQQYPTAIPPYGMSPAMQMRAIPQGPHFGPQPMGGHMMVQQSSNGPFMNGPMVQQMPMYPSPVPGHVQPHYSGHPAQQPGGNGGYGGSPRGHPMSHQGSQQGHPGGQMYMLPPGGAMMMQQHPGQMAPMRGFQAQYSNGPHPQHGYPMQHRGMSAGGYNHQMTPRQHHAAPQAGPSPGSGPPIHNGGQNDEGK